jgi:nitroimidazol reductase NimA-like FMN-containing flavoprotein (pyridoxamine 5'-phosphate oxidase superfamily)
MNDRSMIDRVLAANLYLVLGTADQDGRPWVSPVFFARLDADRLCWVSSPDARHSRNIGRRTTIAVTVFDSTVAVGRAEAVYFDAQAAPATPDEVDAALQALNARLPADKALDSDDLQPRGPLVVYRADLERSYLLIRGGSPEHGNDVDMTVEV